MARHTTLTDLRNNNIRIRYTYHRKKNPKWTIIAIIEEVANEFYLSPTTVGTILKKNDVQVPCADTIAKYTRQQILF